MEVVGITLHVLSMPKWQILHNCFLKACFYSLLRILRCNQLFPGGIDYPVITKNFQNTIVTTRTSNSADIKFWFIPKTK